MHKNGAIYLNIRGLLLLSNRTKICYLRDLARIKSPTMILITESWLTDEILDAEVSVPNYIFLRADRDCSRTHGGCAAWVRSDLSPELVVSRSNAWVETLIFKINIMNSIVVLQYRPPDCSNEKFEDALKVCKEAIEDTTSGDSKIRNILDFGDYNFPTIKWPSRNVYVHEKRERVNQAAEKKQAEMFLNFQDEYFMDNVIETATRGENILDLISTNNPDLILCYKVTVNKKLSDHNTIEIRFNFTFNNDKKEEKVKNPYTTRIFEFDTDNASEEQLNRFEHLMDQFDEDKLDDKNPDEQLDIILKVIEEAVEMSIPRKKMFEAEDETESSNVKTSNNYIPKKVRSLMKRKSKLSKKILSSKNWYKNYQVHLELEEVEVELDNHYKERRKAEESKAIGKLFKDSKYFYKYAKKFSKTNSNLNGFFDENGEIESDPKEMAEMLKKQYQSVASEPKDEFQVKDAEYFFFFTSPDPFSHPFPATSTPRPPLGECQQCQEELPHFCLEDQDLQDHEEQDQERQGGAAPEDWQKLIESHIQRIENNQNKNDQEENQVDHDENREDNQDDHHKEEVNSMTCDWQDVILAIESIPTGAAPGPDGVPAILLKRAKTPMSRIICKLLNKTLQVGEIPKRLKRSLIIPIHKGGSQGVPSNYRPISLTSHIMKSIERVIRKKLVNFLELFNKLDPRQHGSRARRSTLSQLLQYQDDILNALEKDDNLDSVYLDFAKAYDKVDHGILLHKIKSIGITGRIGRWIMNFLTGREQEVLVRGKKSKIFLLVSGVPQGSVLGPLLFLIFIGDISKGVSATILIYVDDSKVYKMIKSQEDVETLQDDLDQIYIWENRNNMKFNGGKFLVMRYGKNSMLKENTLYFTAEMQDVITQVDHCRDLGIIMQDDATFLLQVDKVCKKVKQKCGWILRTFFNRSEKFMRHMYNTLAQPHADYCSQLWSPGEGSELEKLEGVLRTYTSKMPSIKHLNYWQRLQHVKMNSQQRR